MDISYLFYFAGCLSLLLGYSLYTPDTDRQLHIHPLAGAGLINTALVTPILMYNIKHSVCDIDTYVLCLYMFVCCATLVVLMLNLRVFYRYHSDLKNHLDTTSYWRNLQLERTKLNLIALHLYIIVAINGIGIACILLQHKLQC